jgi:hypothetical protein
MVPDGTIVAAVGTPSAGAIVNVAPLQIETAWAGIAGFGLIVITTFWVGPSQNGAADVAGVTSKATEPTAAELFVKAVAPKNVADRLPVPVLPTASGGTVVAVIGPVILVTLQLNVLAGAALKTSVGVAPLHILSAFAEDMVGIFETAMFFVNGAPEHPETLTSFTVTVAAADSPKSTVIV